MTNTTDREPLAAPRDIEGVDPSSTFVRCPDCDGAVYNIGPQRRRHLGWHDELDADIASAQEAAQKAEAAAEAAKAALESALREVEALRTIIGDRPAQAIPLIGEWPAAELAGRVTSTPAQEASPEGISAPDATEPTAGEPDEDAAGVDDLDDGYVDLPVTGPRRF